LKLPSLNFLAQTMANPVVPSHIAIVMDGNGRWANRRYLPRIAGHKQGVEALKRIVSACAKRKVATLTVFAFSSENWNRPDDEVSGLMDILILALGREVTQLQREGVRLRFVGAKDRLSDRVIEGLANAEALTANNTLLNLNVCFNYGGRWDIVTAASKLAAAGVPISEESLGRAMSLADSPDPDLIIRTGGEKRLSNFLLWHAAYSELVFSDLLWPDFDDSSLDEAIQSFGARERRFGKTSDQVASTAPSLG